MTVGLALVAGIALLYLGAELLVRGAVSLALRAGLTPLSIGLTIVAYGTSGPELIVSARAALDGLGDVSMGNVIGSNICNIGLILGIGALIRPMTIRLQVIRVDVPMMVACAALLALVLADGRVSRVEGLGLLAGLAGYTWLVVGLARRASTEAEWNAAGASPVGSWFANILLILTGLAALAFGGRAFVHGALGLAELAGLGQAVIGLTVVAVGTSLPELATSVLAAIRHQADIAIGNIVGSNIFNVLGVAGASAAARPIATGGVTHADLAVMVALSVLLLPLVRSRFTLTRWEGGLLLVLYGGYLGWLLVR